MAAQLPLGKGISQDDASFFNTEETQGKLWEVSKPEG